MIVSFCTGWEIERDGISDYSRYLVDELKRFVDVNILRLNHYVPEKEYYIHAAKEANQSDIAHIQFNYVYFNGELPYRNRLLTFMKHLKVPAVMTVHEVRVGSEPIPPGVTSSIKRMIFNNTLPLWKLWSVIHHKRMYKKPERIIVHTKGQAKVIKGLVDNPEKVMLIPHGIPNIPDEVKMLSPVDARMELGLEGKTILTIFGFINRRKGYELALDALLELPEDVILIIAGGPMTDNTQDREYYDSLLQRIIDMGLKGKVKITGYLKEEDVPVIMSATDICLAPFSSPAASGALSLCIGYNKPIIASDTPVNVEACERIPCVEIFRSGDSKDLLIKIKGILGNKKKAEELSRLAREYSERFSYRRVAEVTVKVYEEVLQG